MENPFCLLLAEMVEIKKMISDQQQREPTPEIIDRKELQKRLGISEPTAISLSKKKKIPVIKLGSSIRYNWPKVLVAIQNDEEYRRMNRKTKAEYGKERRENLTDSYVKNTLHKQMKGALNRKEMPQEIVDTKRSIIKLKRANNENT